MLLCVDVDYRATEVVAACVGFTAWTDELAQLEAVVRTPGAPAPYEPGAFYRRELPHLLVVLEAFAQRAGTPSLAAFAIAPDGARAIIVDGYVWLGPGRAGLGAHLHDAIGGVVPVVGVAKQRFEGASDAIAVRRGESQQPLFVTAIGVDPAAIAAEVAGMHGSYRIPTLIKRVDRLARDT